MAIRLALIAITILACATSAFGQTASARILGSSAPKGVKLLPAGYTTVAQHIIPRYMGGVVRGPNARESYVPAGQLRGWGPASVIRGNADTQKQTVKAVVITQDYGSETSASQWQGGTARQPGYLPAVLQAYVGGLTILGHDEAGDNYANGPGSIDMLADGNDLYGGLFVKSTGHTIEDITVFHIPGTAVVSTRGEGALRNGAIRPFDREKSFLRRIQVAWAYRGIEVIGNDSVLADLEGQALRDYGLKIAAGAHQISGGLHFWGVGAGSDPKAAVWFASQAGPCWGGPIYAESSNVGMLVESAGNMLHDIYSKACWQGNIKITGERNVINRFDVQVLDGATETNGAPGILVANQKTVLRDGYIFLPMGETGIRITNPTSQTIDNVRILGASPQGTGTGIEAKATLNYSTIRADIQWLGGDPSTGGGIGVDLLDGGTDRIGIGNTIWVTYNTADGQISAAEAVQLHGNWSTTADSSEKNDVRINGVRYYRAGD